jgi:hypothetical protein
VRPRQAPSLARQLTPRLGRFGRLGLFWMGAMIVAIGGLDQFFARTNHHDRDDAP